MQIKWLTFPLTSFVNEKLKYVLIYSTQTKKYSHQMVNLVTDIVYEQGGKFLNAGLWLADDLGVIIVIIIVIIISNVTMNIIALLNVIVMGFEWCWAGAWAQEPRSTFSSAASTVSAPRACHFLETQLAVSMSHKSETGHMT